MAKATLLSRIKSNATGRNTSSANTIALLHESVLAYENNGDWTNIAWIVSLAQGADASRLKAIVEAIGLAVKTDKKQPTGLRVGRSEGGLTGTNVLGAYAEKRATIQSKIWTEGFDDVPALLEKKISEFDAVKRATALVAAATKAGCDLAVLKAAFDTALESAVDAA